MQRYAKGGRFDAPKMSDQETARHIARAEGFVGPCRDYLFETTQALREEGIPDRKMERLTALVKAYSEG